MKVQRYGRLACVTIAGALALTACGSDNNTTAGAGSSSSSSTASASVNCAKGTLTGEGSTAQKNAIDQVISDYQSACSGATVNYNPTGSGAGIKQFTGGQVDFAGSDSALNPTKGEPAAAAARCQNNAAWDIPMVVGPIAVAYNLSGVGNLVLTPDVAAKIFLGQITKWDDPAIAAANSGVKLPSKDIKVFFRSDESGTTENFTKWLAAAAPSVWTAAPGKAWTGKGQGRQASAGVSDAVKTTDGGVTYTEWSYAKDNKLSVAQIDNGAGPVTLSGDSIGKAIASAKQSGTGNDLALKLDYATKAPGAYPIGLVTYEIVCSKGLSSDKVELLKSFLTYFSSPDVQKKLQDIGYAPLPQQVQTKVATAIQAIS